MLDSKAMVDQEDQGRSIALFSARRIVLLLLVCSASVSMAQLTVKNAKITIQADDEFVAYLNGHLIHETETIPGIQWDIPQENLPVKPEWFTACGPNVLGIYFYDIPGGATFLIYKMTLSLSDGSTRYIYSDGDERIMSLPTVYEAKKPGGKTWSERGEEGAAYEARLPELPQGWSDQGVGFDDSSWAGTGQCYSDSAALNMDPFRDFAFPPKDQVPAIRPLAVGKECQVEKKGGSYLVRDLFELNPCPNATPTPVDSCPGMRINCGSGFSYLDRAGDKWNRDRGYDKSKGVFFGRAPEKGGADPSVGRRVAAMDGTEDDNLYETYAQANGSSLAYVFDVPASGIYKVTLRFSEPGDSGRSFDVLAEGIPALENFNIYSAAGGKQAYPADQSFSIEVSDGILNLELNSKKGKPILSGVEVTCDPGGTPIRPKGPTPGPTVAQAMPTPTVAGLAATSTPWPLVPTVTRIPTVRPTATLVAQPTKTRMPTATPAPLKEVKVAWKLLSLYFEFRGVGPAGNEVRLNKFKSIEFQSGGSPEKGFGAKVTGQDGKSWDLAAFSRMDPRNSKPAFDVIFTRGPGLMRIDFRDIKLIEVLGGEQAFTTGTGEADLRITLWDGTIHGGGKKP